MESINQNIASALQPTHCAPCINFNPTFSGHNQSQVFNNDIACALLSDAAVTPGFDLMMNNFAAFKDIIATAQDSLSAMQGEGESIRDLIAKAKEEGVTPELLDAIQKEVDSRLANIKSIRDGANFNGINPFDGQFSLNIPNWKDYIGAEDDEEAKNEISEMLASFDIDINIDGGGFSIGASAKIEIGYNDDGSLQINVDASMDYDLSGLLDKGVNSDEAFDMINQFLSVLGVQQGDLGNASNLLDMLFSQSMNFMERAQNGSENEISIENEGSSSLKGKIVQQASIVLDGFANQTPNIAINIL